MFDWEKCATRFQAYKSGMFEGFLWGVLIGGCVVGGLCVYWY